MTLDLAVPTTVSGIAIDHEAILRSLNLNARDPKVQAMLLICERYGIDPLMKHAVLISGNIYITRDGYLHVAHRSGQFDGIEVLEVGETPTHFTAKVAVHRKDMRHPFTYVGRFPKSERMAKTFGPEMAVKVAEVQALRRAFNVTGVAASDERWDVDPAEVVHATTDERDGPPPADAQTGEILAALSEALPPATTLRPPPGSNVGCREDGCDFHGPTADVREHMVTDHGWERTEDGRGGRGGSDDSAASGEPEATPPPGSPPLPENKRTQLLMRYAERGLSARDARLAHASEWLGREVATFSELTADDGRRLLDALKDAPVAPTLLEAGA